MVYCLDNIGDAQAGFVLTPNQSMSWRTLVLFYTGIAAFSLTIAFSFYFVGLSLVLPFSGLEVLVLGAGLYVSARRCSERQVIRVEIDRIIVESGRNNPEASIEMQRAWARVVLERDQTGWYPGRLLLKFHGRQIEIGKFLCEQEREELAAILTRALLKQEPVSSV